MIFYLGLFICKVTRMCTMEFKQKGKIFLYFCTSLLLLAFYLNPSVEANTVTARELQPFPWLIYMGVFAGSYIGDYQYGGNYFSSNPHNTILNNTVFQEGGAFGGQLGWQYHFQNASFMGIVLSGNGNSNKAYL